MSKNIDATCEELLTSWLSLSATVRNERMVKQLTFREVFICHILYREMKACDTPKVTASDIIAQTGMLKSQANKVLVTMEDNGLILREKSETDKRKIYIYLTRKGITCYREEHAGILKILRQVCHALGDRKIKSFIDAMNTVTDTMNNIEE